MVKFGKYEFEVSKGTIKYMRFSPIYFQSNISSVIEFMEICDPKWESPIVHEPENGVGGFSFPSVSSANGEVYDSRQDYVNKTWDIFLYNEDSYDKEVTIDITKIWKLL